MKLVPAAMAADLLINIADNKATQKGNLRTLIKLHPKEHQMKEYLKHLSSPIDIAGKLVEDPHCVNSDTARVVLCMPALFLRTLNAKVAHKLVRSLNRPIKSYYNFPTVWFVDGSFVRALMLNSVVDSPPRSFSSSDDDENETKNGLPRLSRGSDEQNEGSLSCYIQGFFPALTPEQFSIVMKECPNFHRGELSNESLVSLAVTVKSDLTLAKYLGAVSAAFLDGCWKREKRTSLGPRVIKMLPESILNDCEMPFHPDDAPHWTVAQLKAFRRTQSRHLYDWAQLPPDRIVHFERGQLLLAKAWSAQQLSQLTASQWNQLLVDEAGYKLLVRDVTVKGVSRIQFRGEYFRLAHPTAQAYILANYRGDALPDDLLMNVTRDQVARWAHKGVSGLDILQSCPNKQLLKYIGESSPAMPENKHPLYNLKPSALANLPDFELCEHGVSLMTVETPDSLDELLRYPQVYCFLEDISNLITKFNGWDKVNAVKALAEPEYSRVGRGFTAKQFALLKPEILGALSGQAIAQLPFLKDLTNEQYAALPAIGFSHITANHNNVIRLADVPNSHLPFVGVSILDMSCNYWAALSADQLRALGEDRLALLSQRQVAAIKPAVFAAVFTPKILANMPSESLSMVPKEQLMALPSEARQALPDGCSKETTLGENSAAQTTLLPIVFALTIIPLLI